MEWINVVDELPEMFLGGVSDEYDVEPVIVTFLALGSKEPMVANQCCLYTDSGWVWYEDGKFVKDMKYVRVPIVAWMEKPEPYKGE